MILTLICMATMRASVAADFFPISAGTVRKYEDSKGATLINTIEKTVDVNGVAAIPITESVGGEAGRTTYYRVDADQVSIVAYDLTHPLPIPMPVLKLGAGKVSWEYQGKTAKGASGERLWASGEAHLAGQRTVLDKKVDILVVNLRAAVGQGMSGLLFDQTTTYGKGIGIIEQKTISKLGKRKTTTEYKIQSIEPGS